MCFYLRYTDSRGNTRRAIRRVAKEDIPCYKHLVYRPKTRGYVSPFQKTPYKFGETYKVRIRIKALNDREDGPTIGPGLHSHSSKDQALSSAGGWDRNVVVPCVIPKGSVYYYNSEYKEYVSSRLRMPDKKTFVEEKDNWSD